MIDLQTLERATGINKNTLALYARQGKLKGQSIGRMWFITQEEANRFISAHKAQLTPPDGYTACDEAPTRFARCVVADKQSGERFEWDGRALYKKKGGVK